MKDYAAEGRYREYHGKAHQAANQLDLLLGNIAWHTDHARTHPAEPADFDRLAHMLAQARTLETQMAAYLDEANKAAAMAGLPGLTRTHLRQPLSASESAYEIEK